MLLWHGTFSVNSLAHVFGRRRYATGDDSRNSWLLALLTTGEGWHNNHHHYQSSARQGFRWWEIDLTYYVLRALAAVGLVWDLREPPSGVVDAPRPARAPTARCRAASARAASRPAFWQNRGVKRPLARQSSCTAPAHLMLAALIPTVLMTVIGIVLVATRLEVGRRRGRHPGAGVLHDGADRLHPRLDLRHARGEPGRRPERLPVRRCRTSCARR